MLAKHGTSKAPPRSAAKQMEIHDRTTPRPVVGKLAMQAMMATEPTPAPVVNPHGVVPVRYFADGRRMDSADPVRQWRETAPEEFDEARVRACAEIDRRRMVAATLREWVEAQ